MQALRVLLTLVPSVLVACEVPADEQRPPRFEDEEGQPGVLVAEGDHGAAPAPVLVEDGPPESAVDEPNQGAAPSDTPTPEGALTPAQEPGPSAQGSSAQPAAGTDAQAVPAAPPTLAQKVAALERRDGLFPTWVDGRAGRVWLALPAPDADGLLAECLLVEGLATGLGSNPVGLDRGQLGAAQLVRFRRVGAKVLLERQNLAYRAEGAPPDEQRAARESFATSVLWAADVAAEDETGELLVDWTPFLLRDAHGVVSTLARSGQGAFTLDAQRSVLDPSGCLAFPDNLEFEALLTFASSAPGAQVRQVTPEPGAVSLMQHVSLVRLPDPGYRRRAYDPRTGAQPHSYLDYSAPLDRPVRAALAERHRLEPLEPGAERSAVREPIVYYVDPGAPEPVRSALVEGASWWAEAFELAGYRDAFRVEILPPDAHPLDVRYNVVQWVHRSTRGWSYGNSIVDPRTGEILKGHVSLGSLRVRQDRLLFEGLLSTAATGTGRPEDPVQLSLARLRQLAAHEVGHTLGFAHNFSASSCGRASVMDYPAPLVRVDDRGELDVSDAYTVGIGDWDVTAVRWLYGAWTAPEEGEAILADARARGLRYHSDADARPAGAAQPYASLWDNFSDPVTGLENALAVRAIALSRFGPANLPSDEPRARLEEVLAPVYFHHRYQVEAAAKALGGVDYEHVVNEQRAEPAPPVDAVLQRRALAALSGCLQPAVLDVPETALRALAPAAPGLEGEGELFAGDSAPVFDPLAAAQSAAALVVDAVLQPERCARLVDQHRRNPALPSLEEVLESLTDAAFAEESPADERAAELHRVAQSVVVAGLVQLASGPASPSVRVRVEARLRRLIDEPWARREESEGDYAHARALVDEIVRFLDRRAAPAALPERAPALPPGGPIGTSPPSPFGPREPRACSSDGDWDGAR